MQDNINRSQPLVDARNGAFLPPSSTIQGPYQQFTPNSSFCSEQESNPSNRLIPVHINMNREENMGKHSTIYYNISGLILRRGEEFSLILTFNQVFHPDKYHLSLVFKPQTWRNFPVVKIPLNGSSDGWSAKTIPADDSKDNHLGLQILSSSDALIGKYSLLLEIRSNNQKDLSVFQFDIDIYFLFNPWQKNDSCGLLSSDQIAEYVMNEHGQIYLGSSNLPRSIPWYFGQFENAVLLAALTLLNRVQISPQPRIDSSSILRILASKICSDPGGIDGIFPSLFDTQPLSCQENGYSSSPAILSQYLQFNGQSVQGDSGSNWQHAAVFCSLCRSLGIPCRMVTVYNANNREQPIVEMNSNITRPWYLWNECWMRRDDLPKDHSGWQVVDSSSIQYDTKTRRLGPCSVAALKAGILDSKWDTPRIFGLLNGNQRSINNVEKVINTKILTQSLKNIHEFDDLTSNYISTGASNPTSSNHDVDIEMKIPDSLKADEGLNVILNTNNRTNEQRTLTVALALFKINRIEQSEFAADGLNQSIGSGGSSTPIQSFIQHFYLDHNQPKSIQLRVAENHQVCQGCFDSLLKLKIHAIVRETGQIYREEKYILNEDNVTMKLFFDNDAIEIGQSAELNIQINDTPLRSWNHGRLIIDGFGVLESLAIQKKVSSNNSVIIPAKITPLRLGIGRIYATFSTDSLCLSPQAIFLAVTDLCQKKTNANDQVELQQSTTQKDSYQDTNQEKIKTQQTSVESVVDEPLNKAVTDNINADNSTNAATPLQSVNNQVTETNIKGSQPDTNYISTSQQQQHSTSTSDQNNLQTLPSNTFTSQQTSTSIKNEEQEKSNQEVRPSQSTTETTEKPTPNEQTEKSTPSTTEHVMKQEDLTPSTVAPLQTKQEITQVSTTSEAINKEQDAAIKPAIPVTTNDQKTQAFTPIEGTNKPQDATSTSPVVPVSKTETTNYGERKQDEEDKPLNTSPSESSTTSVTEITTTEDKKEDDQAKLSTTPSLDGTRAVVTETTTTVEEKKENSDQQLPKVPSFDNTLDKVTVTTTTVEEKDKGEDEGKILQKTPSLDTTVETITETTTVEDRKEAEESKIPRSPSLDNTVATVTETTTITDVKEDDQSRLSKAPSLDSTTETVLVRENEEDTSDNRAEIVTETTTVEEKKEEEEEDQSRLSKTPSMDNTTETVTETTVVEEKKDDEQEKLPVSPSVDSAIETVSATATTTVDKKDNEEQQRLEKTPSLDTTTETVTEITTVEDKKENNDQQLQKVPSLDNTVETITETTTVEDRKEVEESKIPRSPSLDNAVETVTETTTINDTKNDDQSRLSKTPSVDNTTEVITETTSVEEKKENVETKLPNISSSDNTVETVTETTEIENSKNEKEVEVPETPLVKTMIETVSETTTGEEEKEDNSQISLSKASSLDDTVQVETTTTTVEDKTDVEERKLSSSSSSGDTTEVVTETTVVQDKTQDEEKKLSNIPSLDDTIETVTVDNLSSSIDLIPVLKKTTIIEEKKIENENELPELPLSTATVEEKEEDDEEKKLPRTSSLDTTVETVSASTTVENKDDDSEIKLSKIPSLDRDVQIETTTTNVEDSKDVEERKLPKVPSLDTTTETVTQTTITEDKIENNEQKLSKVPSLDNTLEKVTVTTTTVEEKDKDDHSVLSKTSSVDNITDIVADIAVIQDKSEDQGKILQKTPSLDTTIETITETTTVEDRKETEESKIPRSSSLDNTVATVTETTTITGVKEDDQSRLSKAPSLDSTTGTVTETTTVGENKEKKKLPKVPSLDTTIETVTETTNIENSKEQEAVKIPETPSVKTTIETVDETTTDEDKTDADKRELSKVPSLDTTVETVTQTTTVEEKEGNEETKLPNIFSSNDTTEVVTETTSYEEKKEEDRNKLSKESSLDSAQETDTTAIEDKKGTNEQQSPKIPSLDNPTETVAVITTIEEKDNDSMLSKTSSLDNTATGDEIQDNEKLLPTIPSLDRTTETTTDTGIVDEKNAEEGKLAKVSSSDTTIETTNGTATIHIPVPENIVLDCSFEPVPHNANATIKTIMSPTSVIEVIRETNENEQTTKTEEDKKNADLPILTSDNFRSLDELIPNPFTFDSTHLVNEETSITQNIKEATTPAVEEKTTTVVQVTHTDNDSENKATLIPDSANNDVKVTEDINVSQEPADESLKVWLDNLLLLFDTLEETKTNGEPTSLIYDNTDVLVKKTTVVTETTTTTEDEDVPVPAEDSTKTLKHLVHQVAVSDEHSNDLVSVQNISKDESLEPVTTTIINEHTDKEFVDSNNQLNDLSLNTTVTSPSSVSNIRAEDDTDAAVSARRVQRTTDRTYSNQTNDLETVASDVSLITSISDSDDGSNNEKRNSHKDDYVILEKIETRTITMSTVKNADSSDDEMISDVDKEQSGTNLNTATVYAESLANEVLTSAIHSNVEQQSASSFTTSDDDYINYITPKKPVPIAEISTSDEPQMAPNDGTVSDNSNQK